MDESEPCRQHPILERGDPTTHSPIAEHHNALHVCCSACGAAGSITTFDVFKCIFCRTRLLLCWCSLRMAALEVLATHLNHGVGMPFIINDVGGYDHVKSTSRQEGSA